MMFTILSLPVWEHTQSLNLEKLTGKLVKTPVLQIPHCWGFTQWGNVQTNVTANLPINFKKIAFAVIPVEGPGASATSMTTVKTLTLNSIHFINNASGTRCTYIAIGA